MKHSRALTLQDLDSPKRINGPVPKLLAERFLSKVNKSRDCWNWTGPRANGYGVFKVNIDRRNEAAHRISFVLHNGPIPADLFVLHECDNKLCVNPDHLFLGTHTDNMRDCCKKRRMAHGETHFNAKLSSEEVKAIRVIYKRGNTTMKLLAEAVGVPAGTVRQIVRRTRRVFE